jgi:hypothetical protein
MLPAIKANSLMIKFFLFISIAFLTSCGNNNSSKTEAQESKGCDVLVKKNLHIKPETDSIVLGFALGQEEKAVETHLKELIAQNKLGADVTWNLGSILGKINGWSYDLFLNESLNTKYETLIGYNTYKGKLASLTIFGNTNIDIQTLVSFLNNKFGEFKCTKPGGSKTIYFWFDGYKQIMLTNGLLPFVIEYTDLRAEAEKVIDKEKADSLNAIELKQKAEKSKEDFK